MTPLSRFSTALLLAAVVAGCDFTPTLDIETPTYQDGLVLRSILVADSVATVQVAESWDPYAGRPTSSTERETKVEAVVTLWRDGVLIDRLTARRDSCVDLEQPPVSPGGTVLFVPCGPYAGTVPVEAGGTYTVRAEAQGRPTVEGTVTVPRRPAVDIVEETTEADPDRRFRIRLGDPPGPGDRYGLTLYYFATVGRGTICENDVCRDTTFAISNPGFFPMTYDTSDPVLLAAANEIAGSGIAFASFTDETFDGREKTFTITHSDRYRLDESADGAFRIQLAALSDDLYDAYRISYFSGGGDNPFAEPINLPSNVTGGYGLVGAVTLAEATFGPRERTYVR